MKKFYFILLAICFGSFSIMGQTTLITDDFESYTTGSGIAAQAGAPWGTWSGPTGSAEDPLVTDVQAFAGSNSINVITNNDLVINFEDKTTGRYQITFQMYVNPGAVGYINLLSNFAGSSSEWATQTFFNTDGSATVDADGESAGTFTFNHGEWFNVNYIVDLDDDLATLYVDGNEVITWTYTRGSFGDGCAKKLDAMNMYGWSDDGGTGSNFYIDDLSFIEQLSMDAPQNLAAVVTGSNIQTTWEAPASGTPDSYLLMSNGNVVASGLTDLFYDQTNVYPNSYTYTVRAHFDGLGYSPSSNEAFGTVEGGTDRNLTLFEIHTGTWCGFCPGAAMGADDMIENGHNVAIIEYHNADSYATADCLTRETYYSVEAFPTTMVDGLLKMEGGDATTSIYPSYLYAYNDRFPTPSVYEMSMTVVGAGLNTFEATVDISETNGYFEDGLVLRAALTESHIPENWNGMTEVNFVCRNMYPNAAGTALDFSGSTTHQEVFTFSTGAYVKDNCEFVVFLQHEGTKEIVQVAKVDMETIVGIENITSENISIYPNPATNYINVFTQGNGNIEIYSISGQLLISKEITSEAQTVSVENISNGIYLVKVTTPTNSFTEKLIIK
ncbi:MAG: T9SS type A sorting domain-containing protein [Bacteroidales bacterium]|nr:T9SS type A sorting domain-containing protein [Bacteroidales bacterium]